MSSNISAQSRLQAESDCLVWRLTWLQALPRFNPRPLKLTQSGRWSNNLISTLWRSPVLLFQWKVVFFKNHHLSEKVQLCASSRSLVLLLACCQLKSGGEPMVKIQCQVTDVLLVFVSQQPPHPTPPMSERKHSWNLLQGIFKGSFHYYKQDSSLKQHRGMTGAWRV